MKNNVLCPPRNRRRNKVQGTRCSKLLINAGYQHQQLLITKEESPLSAIIISDTGLQEECQDSGQQLSVIITQDYQKFAMSEEKGGLEEGKWQLEILVKVITLPNAHSRSVSLPEKALDQEPEGSSLGSATHLLYNLGKALNHHTSACSCAKRRLTG